jgi:hypothetical protein
MAANVEPGTIRPIVSRFEDAVQLVRLARRMPRNRAAVPSVRSRDARLRLCEGVGSARLHLGNTPSATLFAALRTAEQSASGDAQKADSSS